MTISGETLKSLLQKKVVVVETLQETRPIRQSTNRHLKWPLKTPMLLLKRKDKSTNKMKWPKRNSLAFRVTHLIINLSGSLKISGGRSSLSNRLHLKSKVKSSSTQYDLRQNGSTVTSSSRVFGPLEST
jgi:hypothetical protein